MNVHAAHKGVPYTLEEAGDHQWRWSFTPPQGPSRSGQVKGEYQFALTVVRRGIDVWHLMNRNDQSRAA